MLLNYVRPASGKASKRLAFLQHMQVDQLLMPTYSSQHTAAKQQEPMYINSTQLIPRLYAPDEHIGIILMIDIHSLAPDLLASDISTSYKLSRKAIPM
jgi:hypothetical protein